jgi:predicted small secreted protein
MTKIARIVAALALIGSTVALAACANTVRGAGRDTQNVGKAITRAPN